MIQSILSPPLPCCPLGPQHSQKHNSISFHEVDGLYNVSYKDGENVREDNVMDVDGREEAPASLKPINLESKWEKDCGG